MPVTPSPLWYAARAAGLVSLILLTAVVVLGILLSSRWATEAWPRFLSQMMHRYVALVAVVFGAFHVVTAVLDPFAHLGVTDAVLPFTSSYRPLWLGFGVVSAELIAALVITSLLRARLGFRIWRTVHWLAYASWPVAMLHGLGTGTDTRTGWALLLDAGCLAAVLMALAVRLSGEGVGWAALRAFAGLVTAAGTVALTLWTVTGPLQAGWARAAGTPSSLLATPGGSSPASTAQPPGAATSPAPVSTTVPVGLSARVSGTDTQNADGSNTLALTDDSDPTLGLTLAVPSGDGSSLQLTVTRSGTSACSTAATFDGRTVTAVCGSTQLSLVLRSSDDGGIRGTLTTVAAGAP